MSISREDLNAAIRRIISQEKRIEIIRLNNTAHADTGSGHTQGTDQGLDTGGANAVTAAQAKAGYTHSTATHAPTNAQKNSDITKEEIEAKLTGAISSHTHAGGSEAFPVGAVFISVVATNPNTLLGYGTWSAFGAGKVLVGLDAGDTDFDTVEETGGAKTVQASAQTFSGSALATHQHDAISAGTPAGTVGSITASGTAAVKIGTSGTSAAASNHTHSAPSFTGTAMGTHQHAAITAGTPAGTNTPGAATSVVQPYIVVYMWKRTA